MAPFKRWPAHLSAPILPSDNVAAAFWQSRHKMARPPKLADLPALARAIRGSK